MPLRIATWNINSVRLRFDLAARLIAEEAPDVLCLQETKCPDDAFPLAGFRKLGYRHAALNGQNVHDNAEIQAITGGALDANETSPGPIMVQGDHNRVWYRKLIVTPISSTDQ